MLLFVLLFPRGFLSWVFCFIIGVESQQGILHCAFTFLKQIQTVNKSQRGSNANVFYLICSMWLINSHKVDSVCGCMSAGMCECNAVRCKTTQNKSQPQTKECLREEREPAVELQEGFKGALAHWAQVSPAPWHAHLQRKHHTTKQSDRANRVITKQICIFPLQNVVHHIKEILYKDPNQLALHRHVS